MSATQAARDYAAEEGLTYTDHEDGSVEVWHCRGAASVSPDGRVASATNHQLKAVLERKIAQARAKEARLQEDPSGRCTIKFSSEYAKMPHSALEMMDEDRPTTLLAVLRVKRGQLSSQFLEWDTAFRFKPGNYPLPDGPEFLVLLLLTEGHLWTTIRAAWPPEKEEWYRSHVGQIVNISIPTESKI